MAEYGIGASSFLDNALMAKIKKLMIKKKISAVSSLKFQYSRAHRKWFEFSNHLIAYAAHRDSKLFLKHFSDHFDLDRHGCESKNSGS